jgi:hypothetical protein
MQIKDLVIGDGYVYLTEGSTKVKFYALCHNYESGLNGKGRTLFCRESPATSGIRCQIGSSYSLGWGTINYFGSTIVNAIYEYLTATYPSSFTSTVRKWIATTKYKAYSAPNASSSASNFKLVTFNTAFFTISEAEAVTGAGHSDGSLLSKEARTRLEKIFTAYGKGIWTRTHSNNSSGHEDDDDGSRDYYYANGLYLSRISDSDWGIFSTGYAYSASYGYLPCFTLSEDLYIDKDGFPTVNQPPEVASDVGESGVALGEKNKPFNLAYTVTDGDGDPMRIVEKVNGVELAVRENVATGTELTVQCLSEKVLFQQILNGESTLTLEADDGKTSTDWTATFTKNVTSAVLSLAQPLTADDTITVAAMTLEGSFPADMSLTVELTNNALDETPVWENCTDIQSGEAKAFVHHSFTNTTAARGFAFNYKVTIARGASGVGGNITMIGGVIG